MPFDQELYEGYCIRYPEKKSRKEKESLFGLLVVLWGCRLFFGMLNAIEEGWNRLLVWLPFYLLTLWLLLRWRSKPEPETMRIWVQGETFCTELNARRSRRYRFSEITRVSYHSQYGKLHRMPKMPPYWAIHVGEECVATFQTDMENAHRLLGKLDKMGLITAYGTGYTEDA